MTVANNAIDTQPANNGPWASPSNVPRTSPKDPIWPSQGRPKLTTWGHLEMTSRERPNLTSRIRPGGTDSGCPQDVLRMSPRRPWKHIWGKMWGHLLDVPKVLFTFLSELIRLTKPMYRQFNIQGVFRTQSNWWRISGLVFPSYILYMLKRRKELAKSYITERQNILLQIPRNLRYIYYLIFYNSIQINIKFTFILYEYIILSIFKLFLTFLNYLIHLNINLSNKLCTCFL